MGVRRDLQVKPSPESYLLQLSQLLLEPLWKCSRDWPLPQKGRQASLSLDSFVLSCSVLCLHLLRVSGLVWSTGRRTGCLRELIWSHAESLEEVVSAQGQGDWMPRSLWGSRESIRNKGSWPGRKPCQDQPAVDKTEKPFISLLVSGRISDMRVSAAASKGYL